MWSLADAIEEIIDVSEIGEQWSPKIPPPKVAATIIVISEPCIFAIGIEIANIIAKVPQEVPVENAIKELTIKTTAGNNSGDNQLSVILAT